MNIAVIMAHPDDEVLGMGATICRYAAEGHKVRLYFMTDGTRQTEPNYREASDERKRAAIAAGETLGVAGWRFGGYPDNMLDTVPMLRLAQEVEGWLKEQRADIIYTHFAGDLNVDHERTSLAVQTACRPIMGGLAPEALYAAEVPSSTGWGEATFSPNQFVAVTEEQVERALIAFSSYRSEVRLPPHPRSREAFRNLRKFWGSLVGVENAEAFRLLRGLA